MNTNLHLYIFLAIVLYLIISRLIFLVLQNPDEISSDRNIYLWLMENIRENYEIKSKRIINSLGPGYSNFTIFPYLFVSYFPSRIRTLIVIGLNVLSDVVLTLAVYFLSLKWLSVEQALYASLLISTSQLLLPANARMASLGGRPYANLLFFFYAFLLMNYISAPTLILLFLTLFVSLIMYNTSIFGSQAIIFVTIILFFINRSFHTLVPLFFSLLFSFILPMGFINTIKGKFHHAKWYLTSQPTRNRASLFATAKLLVHGKLIALTRNVFVSNPLWIIFFSLFPIAYLSNFQFSDIAEINQLILATFILFIITSTYPGFIFGESERYIELCLPFIIITFSGTLNLEKVFALCLYGTSISLLHLILMNESFLRKIFTQDESLEVLTLIQFLKEHDAKNIICSPTKLSYVLGRKLKDKNFLYFNFSVDDGYKIYNEFHTNKLYQLKDNPSLLGHVNADLVVIEKNMENFYVNIKNELNLVFENSNFIVFKKIRDKN